MSDSVKDAEKYSTIQERQNPMHSCVGVGKTDHK